MTINDEMRKDALLLLAQMQNTLHQQEAAGPNVVVVFDPETKFLSAVGPFENAAAAESHREVMDAALNSPQHNDSDRILLWVAPLDVP